jgi:hypothetical protein
VYGGPPTYGARPSGVTTASVLLFVAGGLGGLVYLIALVAILGASGQLSDFGVSGGLIGVFVVVALIGIAAAVLQITGGVHTLGLRRRGRALGLTGSIMGLALALLSVLGGGNAAAVIIAVMLLIGDVAIIVLLAQNGRYLTNP